MLPARSYCRGYIYTPSRAIPIWHITHPRIKAVINFVPLLLDQLENFAEQFATGQIRIPLLRLLATPELEHITSQDRLYLLDSCFLSNHATMLRPYPAYKRLHELYQVFNKYDENDLVYISGQYLSDLPDLLVWYHLAWMGKSVRRNDEFIMRLMAQSKEFSYTDPLNLFNLIGDLIKKLIPRYRKLTESGQIELSTTPRYHPLAPLLTDFASARDSQPDIILPEYPLYPDGRSRIVFQLSSAITSHEQRFNERLAGVWPAEGAVSKALLTIMVEQDCQWSASGEGVLMNTLRVSNPDESLPNRNHYLYNPYHMAGEEQVICIFRDDHLSDLIGFEYARWSGRDAAENLIQSLERIYHSTSPENNPIVSIILDGKNAWEFYLYNAFYFFNDLYSLLDNHPLIRSTIYRDYIANPRNIGNVLTFPKLAAGSWVYGTFSTWIGDKEKDCAWDMLCDAKYDFDRVIQSDRLTGEEKVQAIRQLTSCESSDWFWWFRDYNSVHAVTSFDQLGKI